MMFRPPEHEYRVPSDGSFRVREAPTSVPDDSPLRKKPKKQLRQTVRELDHLQRVFAAQDTWSLLLIFQAMDAAGKDSTIRAVTRGMNPAGFQVYSFQQPSAEALDHDFLWRTAKRLPERGRIGIFNRSYYEEVLVVRVNRELLDRQGLPAAVIPADLDELWRQRFDSIRDHEEHLVRNGVVILKFFLNVSCDEQKERFLSRIDDQSKNWKFSQSDVAERQHWPKYMDAYEQMLNATSRPWAPWFCIPADNKRVMRVLVARIVRETLQSMDLHYPQLAEDEAARLSEAKQNLLSEENPLRD